MDSATYSSGEDGGISAARENAFRKARRHTALVRLLRWALPGSAGLALLTYGAIVYGTISLRQIGIRLGDFSVSADDLKMKNPSYFGVGKDGARYEIRARSAILDISQTGPIKLEGIDGDLYQTSGTRTHMKATRGTLDNKTGRLELMDGVDVDGTDGLKARLRSAEVLTKENRITSKEPVVAAMPAGVARGNTMVLHTKQRSGTLAGDVQLELQPGTAGPSTGIGGDARQPVLVDAARMDFDDMVRRVQFHENVRARQGDTTMTAPQMTVEYEGKPDMAGAAAPGGKAANAAAGGARVSKISARSGVMIVAGADRRIRADAVDFDLKADTALFTGSLVEVNQGLNRMNGRRLAIDRKTGRTRLDAPAEGGLPAARIQTTFIQTEADGKPKQARPQTSPGEGGVATFRTDPGAPMDIEAVSLDINDTAKQATYRGAVRAQQGDMIIQTEELVANYIGETGLSAPPEGQPARTPGMPRASGGGAQVTKVEARSRVTVTSKDGQEAIGDWAIFDVKGNNVLLGGNVTVKRGRDIITGPRLRIDLVTGHAHFENDTGVAPVIAAPFRVIEGQGKSAPKQISAEGPGGLPAVVKGVPVPAQPAGIESCPPGRQCLVMYPEDAKKAAKEKAQPKLDSWRPTTSPSPVYRAPGQQ